MKHLNLASFWMRGNHGHSLPPPPPPAFLLPYEMAYVFEWAFIFVLGVSIEKEGFKFFVKFGLVGIML